MYERVKRKVNFPAGPFRPVELIFLPRLSATHAVNRQFDLHFSRSTPCVYLENPHVGAMRALNGSSSVGTRRQEYTNEHFASKNALNMHRAP